jgi:hypothetical protein
MYKQLIVITVWAMVAGPLPGRDTVPAQAPQKPVRTVQIHTDGGPGTPATLEGLWRQSDLVAHVEIAQSQPDNRTFTTREGGGPYISIKTTYSSNILEVFKSKDGAPPSVDIELMGGRRDRGSYIEEIVDDRTPPLKVGARYYVFLRMATGAQTFLPATADSNSFLRFEGGRLISQGKSDLMRSLARHTPDELASALRSLKGGRDD